MKKTLLLLMLIGAMAGCQTMMSVRSDYLPYDDAALRAVASEIEQAVQKGDREPQIADQGGVVVNTPELTQAIRRRAVRGELVNVFLASGFAWERENALVAIRANSDYKRQTTRRDRDRNALLVMNENSDRWALYEGLLKSSHWAPKNLEAIQRAFHDARVAAMPEGAAFENADGAFQTKGVTTP